MKINERMFTLLKERGKGQNDLADSIGISGRTVSAWKNRGTDPPSNLAPAIAAFLGVSLEWLLTGEEHIKGVQMTGPVSGSAVVGSNHGSVIVRNGQEHILSEEAAELLRLYESFDFRRRIKFLEFGLNLEETGINTNKNAEN